LTKFQPLMPPWIEREVIAGYLLDVAGAWRWISGSESGLARVPEAIRAITAEDERRLAALDAQIIELPPLLRDQVRPLVWVRSDAELVQAVAALIREPAIGLDVETTLDTRALCLMQLAGADASYLVDTLEVTDVTALSTILSSESTTNVIHHAPFEREVLGRHGLTIHPVVDTRELSARVHGEDVVGGHSLRAVCARELGMSLDKAEQTSRWTQRALSDRQISSAALDAEVLLRLYACFRLRGD
jgi:ATP-dependent Lhr-like helicase